MTDMHLIQILSIFQVIGYTDLPSRLPTQASTLYGNNMTKYLLSMGEKDHFNVDLEDDVVRGSIVLDQGKMMWPPPAPTTPPVAPAQEAKEKAVVKPPEMSPFQEKMYEAGGTAGM